MPTDKELMQHALDAYNNMTTDFRTHKALEAAMWEIHQRLAQPIQPDYSKAGFGQPQPEPEPYCWTWDKWISGGYWEAQYGWEPYRGEKRPQHVTDAKPLYTAPPQREWMEQERAVGYREGHQAALKQREIMANGMTEQETDATMSVAGLSKPVIDKTMAKRIATQLGWEPKREWQSLTDEEIIYLADDHDLRYEIPKFARAIEAKLKEKNGG